jgi:arsenate reductase (glutaredoxin)
MPTIYGIPNCNKMKMTFDILKEKKTEYIFHDYKKLGISEEKLAEWLEKASLEELINKKGTTYRALTDVEKESLNKTKSAIEIIIQKPSLLKRPIVEAADGTFILDFLNQK